MCSFVRLLRRTDGGCLIRFHLLVDVRGPCHYVLKMNRAKVDALTRHIPVKWFQPFNCTVDMAMKVSFPVAQLVASQRDVAGGEPVLAELSPKLDLLKETCRRKARDVIVIANNQSDSSIEELSDPDGIPGGPGEVTKMVDKIMWLDGLVPPVDYGGFHFIKPTELRSAITDDVLVPEMRV